MSTFEGPMMAIKTVNSLSHYTDWTIGHVHSGALGWVGWFRWVHSTLWCQNYLVKNKCIVLRRLNGTFWLATIGIVLYIASLWISGVMEGLMWRAINTDGTLTYTFVESVKAKHPYYLIRLLGGTLYLSGMLIMLWNVLKTASNGRPAMASIPPVAAHA
jgi:cytochrome c oxidase cbb3-type subunit I